VVGSDVGIIASHTAKSASYWSGPAAQPLQIVNAASIIMRMAMLLRRQ
jgi:hypothetical protein